MQKPRVFISHISEESELADILKNHLLRDFLNMIDVFVSSDNTSIPLGNRWLDEIDKALKEAQVELILCSPLSIKRPWINFEAGAGWIRGIPVVPVCHTGLLPANLPVPLNMLQSIEAHEVTGIQKLYILVANNLGASTPNIDFNAIIVEIADFEKRYSDTQAISVVLRSESERSIEPVLDHEIKGQTEGEQNAQQEIGLVEGQKAAKDLLAIASKIVSEANRTVSKVSEKLDRFGKSPRSGQDHKIAQQIAYELNTGAGRIEALLTSFQGSVNNAAGLLVGYTNWLLERTNSDRQEIINFRQQMLELRDGLEVAIERVTSNRDSVYNLRILSADVGRASSRMAQAIDEVISLLKEMKSSCSRCIQLIDERLENENTGINDDSGRSE